MRFAIVNHQIRIFIWVKPWICVQKKSLKSSVSVSKSSQTSRRWSHLKLERLSVMREFFLMASTKWFSFDKASQSWQKISRLRLRRNLKSERWNAKDLIFPLRAQKSQIVINPYQHQSAIARRNLPLVATVRPWWHNLRAIAYNTIHIYAIYFTTFAVYLPSPNLPLLVFSHNLTH